MRETRGLDFLKKFHPDAHWQTISGLAQGGVFDINGCKNKIEVWVELKQDTKPKTIRGLIKPKVQTGQPGWQALRQRAGGNTYVGLSLSDGSKSTFYLLPGWTIKELVTGINLERLEELRLDPMKIFGDP